MLTPAGRDLLLTSGASAFTSASVHTGVPDNTGSQEATGGGYARQTLATAASSGGGLVHASSALTFSVNAGSYYTLGLWSGTTFCGYGALAVSPKKGVATMTSATGMCTSYAHGLSLNDTIVPFAVMGEPVPTNVASVLYYVIAPATDTFQISATANGPVVTPTTAGEFAWQRMQAIVMSSPGTIIVPASSFTLNGAVL